ncbi:RNA-directed DNA polymerase, partial [Lysinibacillus agricola]
LGSLQSQYQKVLFYKYFFANPKPLIITECKTDIAYLKAALKSLYSEYPSLITKKVRGHLISKYLF